MPIALNEQTGEVLFLGDDGSWQRAQTAVHPQSKKMVAFDGRGWIDVPSKSRGVLSYIDDAVRSIANGLTLGYADELAAKGNELIGRGTYEENVKAERERDAQIHPAIGIPGQIAGAMAIPVGGLMGGATVGARALRGAGVGGGFGAVAGSGEGTDTPSRAAGALVGGAIGAATGGAAVPVVEGLSRGVGMVLSKPIEIARSAVNPEAAAERAVGRAYQGAERLDPMAARRLAPGEVQPGGPARVLDTMGEQGRDLARSSANLSGEARDTLNAPLNDRYTQQAGRLTDWLNQKFAFPNAHATQEAIDQAQKTVNRPAYAKAYQSGDRAIWDDSLAALAEDPTVLAAMRRASVAGRAEETRQGIRPFKQPFDFTGSTVTLKRDPNGNTISPNLQYWDVVKRELDKGGRDSQLFAKALRDHLDTLVPEYKSARAGAASFFGAENALEAGQNYVLQNFATPQTRAALAKMTQGERQLFQQGFVSRYVETINQTPDRSDVVRRIYNSPAAREKIELALGPQNARELEAMLRVENIMQQGLRGVHGNSTTARQLTQLGLAGAAGGAIGAGGGGALGYDPTVSGIVGALTAAGKSGVDRRVAERVARLLVSDDPAVINRAVQSLAASPRLMQALRAADSAGAKAAGSQSGGIVAPSMQIPAIGRADDEPTVPRPPGQR